MRFSSNDIMFFFGAGASAPFGIPTMKQFVGNFENYLNENADKDERELYSDIKSTLEKKIHRPPDLEAVFTVIDGIISYDNPEKLGMFSLYFATQFKDNFPSKDHVVISQNLKRKFQSFIKENCAIPDSAYELIGKVYKDFFQRIELESSPEKEQYPFAYNSNWTLFTTNYDLCLEYYFFEVAGIGIDTGFEWNYRRKIGVLDPLKLLEEGTGEIKLFKLHGSVNWQIEEKTRKVIERMEKGSSLIGRKYVGELMLYPIAEKQLYFEPYISMLVRLNRELERKNVWIVIGYSFNDLVIRSIFLKHSSEKKHLILVHPNAEAILNQRLSGIKSKISPIQQHFGLCEKKTISGLGSQTFSQVNHQIMHKLVDGEPRFRWDQFP